MNKSGYLALFLMGLIIGLNSVTFHDPANRQADLLHVLLDAQDEHKLKCMMPSLLPLGESGPNWVTRGEVERLFPELGKDSEELGKKREAILELLEDFRQAKFGIKRFSVEHLGAFLAAESSNDFYDYIANPKKLEISNTIRTKMAGHWIRNAALRVFHDDLRSFLELVVNARDAMLPPDKAVGKFGMGFFSILSFLGHKETQGVTIDIETNPKDAPGYGLTIAKSGCYDQWSDGDIFFTIKKASLLTRNGTKILIKPNSGHFSKESLSKLREYLYYLEFQDDVKMRLTYQEDVVSVEKTEIIGNAQADKEIVVFLKPSLLMVCDEGSGISIESALSNLLIPSFSTKASSSVKVLQEEAFNKGVELPLLQKWHGKNEKQDENSSYFLITVNGVVVVHKRINDKIVYKNQVKDLIIQMPQATQVTLARDELTILPHEQTFEEVWLKNVIDETIDASTNNSAQIPLETLLALYRGLAAWEEQSALSYIKGRFTSHFKKSLEKTLAEKSNIVAVPALQVSPLKKIVDNLIPTNQLKLLPLEDDFVCNNFSKLEDILVSAAGSKVDTLIEHEALQEKITKGTKLIFLADHLIGAQIKSCGLRTILFVPQSILDKAVQDGAGDAVKIKSNLFDGLSSFSEYALLTPNLAEAVELPVIVSTISDDITWKIGYKELVDYSMDDFYTYIFNKRDWTKFNIEGFPFAFRSYQSTQNLFKHEATSFVSGDDLDSLRFRSLLVNDPVCYNKFLLFSLLYRFGITSQDTPGSLYLHMHGKLTQIWPLITVDEYSINNLILTLLPYTYGDLRLVSINKDLKNIYNPRYWIEPFPYKSKSSMSKYLKGSSHLIDNHMYKNPLWTFEKHARCTVPGFIGMSDMLGRSESEINQRINMLKENAQKALCYTFKLQEVVEDVLVNKYFLDLAKIEQAVQQTPETKNMFEVIYALYEKYFALEDSDIPCVYGEKRKIRAINPFDDVLPADVVQFITDFSFYDNRLMDKLISFQKEDFFEKTNLDVRTEDLKAYKLCIPSFLSNTPLSVLACLKNKGVELDIIAALVKQSRSHDELLFVAYLFLYGNNAQKVIDLKLGAQEIEHLIEFYIQKRVYKEKRKEICDKNREKESLEERLDTFNGEESLSTVQEYFKLQEQKESLCDLSESYNSYRDLIPESTQAFSLKKLMKVHSIHAGLQEFLVANDLDKVLKKIAETTGEIAGNKIMQCVEVGSERSPLQASVAETLQNSLDAVKSFLVHGGWRDVRKIKLTLGKIPNNNKKSCVCYLIKDEVGMASLENLLADVILPDYSRKSPGQENIGDMGNGLFQVYKDAQEVMFITRLTSNPNKIFLLQVTPLRNEDGFVYDLKLRCVGKEPGSCGALGSDWFGTCIAIKFREQEDRITTMKLLDAKDFIYNCAGATNVDSVKVMLNDIQINHVTPLLSYIPEHDQFKKYERAGLLLESYLTTGGVPFRPLGEFLRESDLLPLNLISLINSGIIIDLPLGSYQPVQSRTHVKMSPEHKQKLREFLLEVVYWRELERVKNNQDFLDSYFTHFSSQVSDFYQVKLSKEDNDDWAKIYKAFKAGQVISFVDKKLFFTNYTPLSAPHKNFYTLIVDGYGSLVEKLEKAQKPKEKKAWDAQKKEFFDGWRNLLPGRGNNILVDNVVTPWFEKKVEKSELGIQDSESGALEKEQQIKNTQRVDTLWASNSYQYGCLKDLLNKYLSTYVQSFYTALKRGAAPSIDFYFESSGTLGYFCQGVIRINLEAFCVADILHHVDLLAGSSNNLIDVTNGNCVYKDLFGCTLSTGTIIHELEHARRNEFSIKGVHTSAMIDGKRMEFNACAHYFARQAVSNGCLQLWKSKLGEAFEFCGISRASIDKIVHDLRELEALDKKRLMEKLGFMDACHQNQITIN